MASATPVLQLPSQPPVGGYQIILLGDRGTCVNYLPRVELDSGAAGIRTCDLLIASPAPYRYATEPHWPVKNNAPLVSHERFLGGFRVGEPGLVNVEKRTQRQTRADIMCNLLLHCALAICGTVYCNWSCLWVCNGRAVSEPYYNQRAQCLHLSECFFRHVCFCAVRLPGSWSTRQCWRWNTELHAKTWHASAMHIRWVSLHAPLYISARELYGRGLGKNGVPWILWEPQMLLVDAWLWQIWVAFSIKPEKVYESMRLHVNEISIRPTLWYWKHQKCHVILRH